MSVYIDRAGHLWSPDREELHDFAARIRMSRSWFQDRPVLYHYDVMVPWRRQWAIREGAILTTSRALVTLMRSDVTHFTT